MRKPIIAGNWKMNKTVPESLELVRALREKLPSPGPLDVIVLPPFPSLFPVGQAMRGSGIELGAQNLSHLPEGAVTGEVSGAMLIAAGCRYVLVGHSERRKLFAEDGNLIHGKIKTALSEGLHPILCVGESWEEREAGRTNAIISGQVREALDGVTAMEMRKIILAYEPVWAIGTGKNAAPPQVQEVHQAIRKQLASLFDPELANTVRVIYGGSVTPENSASLLTQPDVDGALVGGASLDADSFYAIINAVQ